MNPSDTRQVYYFFTVPKEVQDSDRMVELNMKTSGAITDGEVITNDNSEFYEEYSEFTKRDVPSHCLRFVKYIY